MGRTYIKNIDGATIEIALRTAPAFVLDAIKSSKDFRKLDEWIKGISFPTYRQLQKLAEKLRIPWTYFLLPPQSLKEKLQKRFEGLPSYYRSGIKESKIPDEVKFQILYIRRMQLLLSEMVQSLGRPTVGLIGKYSSTNDPRTLAQQLKQWLNISDHWFKHVKSPNQAFNLFVDKMSSKGINVSISSVVEHSKVKIQREDCQGFALVDDYAPWIFINSEDSYQARLFTLIHELVHLALGHSSIDETSGLFFRSNKANLEPVEIFCNQVAGLVLVSDSPLYQLWQEISPNKPLKDAIYDIAKEFKVSRPVIAFRLRELNLITDRDFFDFLKELKKEEYEKPKRTGGSANLTIRNRIGKYFLTIASEAVAQNKVSIVNIYRATKSKYVTYELLKA
ncbi:MAG: ImmA/IrrE family metallo-endopeptidase [Chlorobi bacterium]|nr:ImmA/IrrE family metallo-endopeptidase [Chlorobiota bacterium]